MSNTPRILELARPVDEHRQVDQARFENEIVPGHKPVVMRGLADDWPLTRAGQGSSAEFAEYLDQFNAGQSVSFFEAPPEVRGRYGYTDDLQGFNFERREAPLRQFLRALTSLEGEEHPLGLYAGAINIEQHLPGLDHQNNHGLLRGEMEQLVSLWLGNKGRTAAHFDLPQNIACVVRGKRRFVLLPIGEIANLYVGPLDRTLAGQPVSLVEFMDPDLERHPRFEQAMEKALVAELEPGDAIYIPSMWFHHVESLGSFGALLNFWWRDAPAYMPTPMITLFHSLLTLKALPEEERRAWKTLFDHYIFALDGEPMAHLPESARGLFGEIDDEKLARLKHYLSKSLR